MPSLSWPTKAIPPLEPSTLFLDSQVFPYGNGYPKDIPRDMLFLGDNFRVMSSLLEKYADRINLIYADPPFFTNKRFKARIGRGEDSRRPTEWQTVAGYADHWDSLDAYLDFLYPRLALMVRLLAPNGTIYLHLDWHANAYARLLMDELMGGDRLLNEIVWTYHGPSPILRAFNRKHDVILIYTRGAGYTFNPDAVRESYHPNTVKTFASSPRAGFGKIPNLDRGKVPEDWWYFPVVARLHNERTGYPTQKPEALLRRILLASSNPGDLVADFFCGSGSFPVVAAGLQRNFLAADLSWQAIHTTRKRLVQRNSEPFSIFRESSALIPQSTSRLAFNVKDGIAGLVDPPELDFWEVDPAWDGNKFMSVSQAVRGNRSSEIPDKLEMIIKKPATGSCCMRAVCLDGTVIQSKV